MQIHDYIVVGAGSAGCPLARGLSDDPDISVLLLEAGPHADRFWVHTPAGMAKLYFDRVRNWNFRTEPMPRLHDRQMYWPRGKMLGGSSAINGMVFIRGHPGDFDGWRARGNPGWGYDDVLPHFRAMERFERGGDAWRGGGGPLSVSDPIERMPSSHAFIAAARALGVPPTEDMNGEVHDGVGFMQHSIRNGRRHSAYNAFVEPVRDRPNLTVRTGCAVQRVLFDGRQAIGVEVRHGDGRVETIHAAREVILSAGSIKSPQMLMLSGIGPGEQLRRRGVTVLHDLPGVGRNLQDHFYVHTAFRATADSSYNARLTGWRKYREGLRYLATRKGCLALGSSQVAAFVKGKAEEPYADLQISFRPMTFNYHRDGQVAVDGFPGMGVSVYQLRPTATGTVTLASPDAADKPLLTPNFLTSAYDVETMIEGIRTIRRIMAAPPMASRVVAEEIPGPGIASDDQIHRFMEETGNSAHHQGGTARMGNDPMAVVDARLRVHGVERLRVVDASIMPFLTSGNTNAPTIMIGVKAAAMIRQDAVPRRPIARAQAET